jgi:phosphotriesterase-related protein
MATVETVLGPVEASELGVTLSHEHVLVSAGNDVRHYPWMFDLDATRDVLTRELTEAKAGGIDTIIDLTTPDLGRDVRFVEQIARATGVHIVVATGIWRDVPRSFWTRDPDEIADIFVREIEVGIGDTSIKAGAIKVASDVGGVTREGALVLRGAARASIRTGCPISTHHWAPEQVGLQQLAIFEEEGVPPHQVCIGHSADTDDVDYLEGMLQRGVYLSLDRYPGSASSSLPWETRNATVKALIDRGWVPRLMLGHDYAPRPVRAGVATTSEGPTRYLFVSTVAIPALLEAGVSQSDVDTMMRDVPRRFLSGES